MKYGVCRICLKYTQLTEDHVPPTGGIDIKPLEIKNAMAFFIATQRQHNSYVSHNGIKFKSLCKNCNNIELGKKLDPVLNVFAKNVGKYVGSKLCLPNEMLIETRPNAIIRAVLGHLLAAKSEVNDYGFDNEVREFLLDENKPVNESINIFYWVYPYKVSIILRDFTMPAVRGKLSKVSYFNLLKYFPIAYLVSNINKYEGLYSLNKYRDLKPSKIVKVPVRLNFNRSWLWPEAPDQDNYLIMGATCKESIYATKKEDKGKE